MCICHLSSWNFQRRLQEGSPGGLRHRHLPRRWQLCELPRLATWQRGNVRPNAWVWQILSPGHHMKITWKWQTAIGGARWRIWPKGALGLDSNGSNSCATCSLKLKKDVTWFLKCFKPFTLKAAFSRSLTQRRTGFSKGPPGRQLSLEILDVLGEILPCRLHKLRTTHGQTV